MKYELENSARINSKAVPGFWFGKSFLSGTQNADA